MAVKLSKAQKELIQKAINPISDEKVLEVKNLTISFKTDNGKVRAVRGVSFDLHKGETLCIVGESGSGKSVTSKAILGILSANAIVEGGQIIYRGEDLLQVSEEEYHRIRGHQIGMIFQDPLSSLNPIVKIGKQIIETMLINSDQKKNYYNELIADELTAYTNAKVVRASAKRFADNRIRDEIDLTNRKIAKLNEKIRDLNGLIFEAKRKKEDTSKYLNEINSIRAEIASTKAESKKVIDELKADKKVKVAEANAHYKEIAPGLKKALNDRKKVAKELTKEHVAKAKEKYLAKNAEIDKEIAAFKLSEEDAKRLEEIDKKIEIESGYDAFILGLNYFFNKRKQMLRMKFAQELDVLKKERLAIPGVKELDALKTKKKEIYKNYRSHIRITKKMAREKALQVMKEVGIPEPEKRFNQYPFQFSGGMRQRIVIAIALVAEPHILICDEPTTALDVTIQAQILELINRLKEKHNMSVIFITHDLGVVANMADTVAVMYAGKIVEYGTDKEVFFDPRHPYTWALLSSIPDIDSKEKLAAIPGTPPDMIYPPEGDAFALRNNFALAIDFKYEPPFFEISPTHKAATWLEHENAPEVEPPKIVVERIYKALENEEALVKHGK